MANEKFSTGEMINALVKARGMKTVAAKNLGCAYNTVQRYINKHPTVAAALEETKNELGDSIESTLLSEALGQKKRDPITGLTLSEWEKEPNITALIFLAKTHPAMRERGYGEMNYSKNEHTGKDGGAIETKHTFDPTNMSDDELKNLIAKRTSGN